MFAARLDLAAMSALQSEIRVAVLEVDTAVIAVVPVHTSSTDGRAGGAGAGGGIGAGGGVGAKGSPVMGMSASSTVIIKAVMASVVPRMMRAARVILRLAVFTSSPLRCCCCMNCLVIVPFSLDTSL